MMELQRVFSEMLCVQVMGAVYCSWAGGSCRSYTFLEITILFVFRGIKREDRPTLYE